MSRQIEELEVQLRMARRDSLTSLPGRTELIEKTETALSNKKFPVSLLFMDLNGFKKMNDTMGHAAGDSLLIQFTAFLRAQKKRLEGAGETLTVARLHGDEFAILLLETSQKDALKISRDIQSALKLEEFVVEGQVFHLCSAIGVASTETLGCSTADALLYNADKAMYFHKKEMREEGKISRKKS